MKKHMIPSLKVRKGTVLSVYRQLMKDGVLQEEGAAMKRYDELLKRRPEEWKD